MLWFSRIIEVEQNIVDVFPNGQSRNKLPGLDDNKNAVVRYAYENDVM